MISCDLIPSYVCKLLTLKNRENRKKTIVCYFCLNGNVENYILVLLTTTFGYMEYMRKQ